MGAYGTLCDVTHEAKIQVPPVNLDVLIAEHKTPHRFPCYDSCHNKINFKCDLKETALTLYVFIS